MGILIIIASFILLVIFFLKIVMPFLLYFSDKIENKLIKKSIDIIGILIMISSFIIGPVVIIKNIPKSKEQIADKKLLLFRETGNKYKTKGKYDLAYNSYDSAEQYSDNPLSFHYEKSEMKFMKGDYEDAISIISKKIIFEENKNNFESNLYEQRSMCFFKVNNYLNAIKDLKTAVDYDYNYANEWNTQISMMYLLMNEVDSAQSYIIKTENSIDIQDENDREECLKEQNLLKSLIFLKKNDNLLACSYFKEYKKYINTPIHYNYTSLFFNVNIDNCEKMYSNLFNSELSKLSNICL
jgi:hypothetical protein